MLAAPGDDDRVADVVRNLTRTTLHHKVRTVPPREPWLALGWLPANVMASTAPSSRESPLSSVPGGRSVGRSGRMAAVAVAPTVNGPRPRVAKRVPQASTTSPSSGEWTTRPSGESISKDLCGRHWW